MKNTLLLLIVLTTALFGVVAQAADSYPPTTCVVSGEKLGEMGAPVIIDYKGTEVRFCCNGCVKRFNADPARYLAKLGKKEPSR